MGNTQIKTLSMPVMKSKGYLRTLVCWHNDQLNGCTQCKTIEQTHRAPAHVHCVASHGAVLSANICNMIIISAQVFLFFPLNALVSAISQTFQTDKHSYNSYISIITNTELFFMHLLLCLCFYSPDRLR